MKRFLFAFAALTLTGCPAKDDPKPAPVASSSAAVVASTSASAAPSTSASAAPNGAAGWTGSYTLTAATISIPSDNPDYKGVKQAKDDPSKFMGDGKIDLSVEASGRVTGTIDGPAGPAVVSGAVVEGEIRGQVARKDPKDEGLTGTLAAKIAGDSAEGKLSLSSEGNAELVREGKVTLKKK